MLNLADYYSISHLFSVSLKTIDHFNRNLLMFYRHNASFEILVIKVQDFLNFELSPMKQRKPDFVCKKNGSSFEKALVIALNMFLSVFIFFMCKHMGESFQDYS